MRSESKYEVGCELGQCARSDRMLAPPQTDHPYVATMLLLNPKYTYQDKVLHRERNVDGVGLLS